jgi:hypothetical protein
VTLFLIIVLIILALISLLWSADVRTTIAFVIDKGGFWLDYSTGLGRFRLVGFQIRMMSGHKPRAWMHKPLTGKLKTVEFQKTIQTLSDRQWQPIHIPVSGALDIGVNIIIDELNVKAKFGLEDDAAATALLCGSISTLLQSLRAVSTRGRFVPQGRILIRPVFGETCLSIRFKCILAIKARHIIREVIESLARRNRDGQSSDRKHYADNNGKYPQHG